MKYSPRYKPLFEPIMETLSIFQNRFQLSRMTGLRRATIRDWQIGVAAPTLLHLGKIAKAYPFMKTRLLDAISKGWDTLPPPPPPKPYPTRTSKERQHRPLRLRVGNPRWAFFGSDNGSVPEDEETAEDRGTTG